MRKKISWILIIFICLSTMKIQVWADELSKEERKGTELLVLMDNSESIFTNKQREKEFEWAENICAYMYGTGITLKFLWFDENKEDNDTQSYKNRIIDGSDLKNCIEELRDNITHKGDYTDLGKAMDDAQEYFKEESNAKNQYIFILSDGEISLSSIEENDTLTEAEKKELQEKARKELEKKVQNFVSSQEEGKRGIVLTSLYDKDIHQLYGNKKENAETIVYEHLDENLENIIKTMEAIFNLMNIPINTIKQEKNENGKFSFKLEKDCNRAIINIRTQSKEVSLKNVAMEIKYKQEEDVKPDDMYVLEHSAYVYLNNPIPGEYDVTLPDGTYTYNVIYQQYYDLDTVELVILDVNEQKQYEEAKHELLDKGIKEYKIEGDSFILGMKLNGETEANRYNYHAEYCMIENMDDKKVSDLIVQSADIEEDYNYQDCETSDKNSLAIQLKYCNDLEKGKYAFKLKVYSGQNICFSKWVIVDVLGTSEITTNIIPEETIPLEIGQEYQLNGLVNKDSEQTWYMVIKQRKDSYQTIDEEDIQTFFRIGEDGDKNSFFDADKNIICFKKDGRYIAEIQDEKGNIVKNVTFEVSEDKNGISEWVIISLILAGVFILIVRGIISHNK